MRLSLAVRDLLHASWEVDRDSVVRAVPAALEPLEVNGAHVVSLFALRAQGSRFGRLPVPRFSQLKVGTHVLYRGERAVFFLRGHATPSGLGAAVFGLPYKPARLRVRKGVVEAPGVGVSLAYETGVPADPGELERAELGLMEGVGLRAFRVRRVNVSWTTAKALGPARADLLLALGFDVGPPASAFYSGSSVLEIELPPRRVSSSSSRSVR